MTHQFVENFSDYTAVLLRCDNDPSKEDRWIRRCFDKIGFVEQETSGGSDEMVFLHTESSVRVACDGDALAIYPVDDPKALPQCLSDLFLVMKNMEWSKAEVYTMGDVDEIINEMAAFIPASYDLSLEAAANPEQEALVGSLRNDIQAQQHAQSATAGEAGAGNTERVVKMADLLPVAGEQHQAVDQALLLSLARGQEAMLQQFSGLAGLLEKFVGAQVLVKGDALRADPDVILPKQAATMPTATQHREPRESEFVQGSVSLVGDRVNQIQSAPLDDYDVGADTSAHHTPIEVIGHIPPHPDSVEDDDTYQTHNTRTHEQRHAPLQPSRVEVAQQPAQYRPKQNPQQPPAKDTSTAAKPMEQQITAQQQVVIQSITNSLSTVVHTLLTEMFAMQSALRTAPAKAD